MPLYPTLVVLSSNNKKNWKFVLMQYLLWCSPSLLSNLLVFMWHVFSVLNFAQHSSPILLQKIWYVQFSSSLYMIIEIRRAYQLQYLSIKWYNGCVKETSQNQPVLPRSPRQNQAVESMGLGGSVAGSSAASVVSWAPSDTPGKDIFDATFSGQKSSKCSIRS